MQSVLEDKKMSVLSVKGIYKEYPGVKLQDVSFEIEKGMIMGCVGRNGAGNSASVDLRVGSSSINRIRFASNTIRNEFRANALETRLNNIFKQNKNIVKSVKSGFTKEFAQNVVNRQDGPIIISITGESASGKSTLCSLIEECAKAENLPISFLPADNYFRDISALIAEHGSFDNLLAAGFDVDSPNNFNLEQLYEDL